jgi:CRP/FNR family transcriptional regulator
MPGNLPFQTEELKAAISQSSRTRQFRADEVIIKSGEEILFIPIVIKGSIRVLRQNENGSEVFLYHLYPGETCAMSLSCCQAKMKSMVKAVAEKDTEIMQIPVKLMDEWMTMPEWKAYVSGIYQRRFSELLEVIDLIAFNHLDEHILHYLRERAKALDTRRLGITHQEIADELHTHREAVSRLLRSMEKKDMVRLGRNSIELLG